MVRIFLLLLEFTLFIVFLYPAFLHVRHAGNRAGMLGSAGLFAATLFWHPLYAGLRRLWNLTAGRMGLCLLAGLLGLGVLFAAFCTVQMVRAQTARPPQDVPEIAVVLGCRVKGTKPSQMLCRRLDSAVQYLQIYPEALCVVSGGQGKGEDCSEAQAMQAYLLARGIARERILLEDRSVDTRENLLYTRELLERRGLSPQVTLITDGFHQYRARLLARQAGLTVLGAVSAPTRRILLPGYWVREWMGLLKTAWKSGL